MLLLVVKRFVAFCFNHSGVCNWKPTPEFLIAAVLALGGVIMKGNTVSIQFHP